MSESKREEIKLIDEKDELITTMYTKGKLIHLMSHEVNDKGEPKYYLSPDALDGGYVISEAVVPSNHQPIHDFHRAPHGLYPKFTDTKITERLFNEIRNEVDDPESDIRKVCAAPFERTFCYIDISDFSKQPPAHQALIAATLSKYLSQENRFSSDFDLICIGDGYILVTRDAVRALFKACRIATRIQNEISNKTIPVRFHFRIGLHVGLVFPFWDVGKKAWNYAGDGINGGQRVLSVIGKELDDVIFVSWEVVDKIRNENVTGRSERLAKCVLNNLENKGRRQDKHDRAWRVYQVNHTRLIEESDDIFE